MVTDVEHRADMENVWEKQQKQIENSTTPVDFLNDHVSSVEDSRYFDTKTKNWVRYRFVLNLIEGVVPNSKYRVTLTTDGNYDYTLRVENTPWDFFQMDLDTVKARKKVNDIVNYIENSIGKENTTKKKLNNSVGRILKANVSKTEVRDYIGVRGTHAEILAMLSSFPQDMIVIWKRADGDDFGSSIKRILQHPERILSDYGPPDGLDIYITDVVDDEIYLSDSSRIEETRRYNHGR